MMRPSKNDATVAVETSCQCKQGASECAEKYAKVIPSHRYCRSNAPGEMFGQTVCNTEDVNVGYWYTCGMVLDQNIYDLYNNQLTYCQSLYYVTLAGCLLVPEFYWGCAATAYYNLTVCQQGAYNAYVGEACFMYKCQQLSDAGIGVAGYVLTSMGGEACTGE